MIKRHDRIVANKECNCSKGKYRIDIVFPTGVTREFITRCKSVGFTDMPEYTKVGLLFIKMGHITVSGALCMKNASIVCSCPSEPAVCSEETDKVLAILNNLF